MAKFRIGELLKARGLLNDTQIAQILDLQKVTGHPFGAVAAELFGVQEAELWRAWAQQMIDCCPKVYASELTISKKALTFLNAREAWAYRLLPVEWTEDEIVLVTTPERLPNAMAYAQIKSPVPAVFAVADRVELEAVLRNSYELDDIPQAA
jgi:hypothetical protein